MRRLTIALAAWAAVAAAAAAAETRELETHRARWEAAATQDYVYAYRKYCECNRDEPPETVVTVRDARVARVHHEHAGSEREVPAREGSLDLYWTVDGLFTVIANALDAGADVRASYDTELGFPRELYVDYDPELIGDELDLRVTRFVPDPR